ncbi:hypothetical protein B0A48_06408 [Cryoendolithus antarcticus]|uniref:1,3-beta-glucanosyltransferase n=1 Tax=Cryoendolithus antarcticus TaxID=1507870 RepID=A0A1V8TBC3_9PEZI|nr:hypothetical protein B0A48_06408 [Cryoendolithus antarcticus]
MLSLLALGLLAGQAVSALPTISTKGSKFFTSDGNQFFLKGVAYQLTEDDPLAQPTQCALDAALMKELGANSIRVYHVDPTASHDVCMKTFDDAGIYIWLDLDTFSTYIMGPGIATPVWNSTMYEAYGQVMDAFHNYDNLAGFFVGNEVLTTAENSNAAPYVKAAGRDMKSYRDSKGYRNIPIGYSAADVPSLRPMLQNYLACGSNQSEALDFFGLNAYEWCGDSTFEQSGYQFLQQNASDYNIPIFFSETGCQTVKPRTFGDQAAILGSDMSGTWSGAIIYEWLEETNDYGLISYGTPAPATATAGVVAGYTRSGTPIPISPDFSNLKAQWATLSPASVSQAAYTQTMSPVACPDYTAGAWEVSSGASLPTQGQAAQNGRVSGSASSGSSAANGQASSTGGSASSGGSGTSAGGASATSAAAAASSSASSASTTAGRGSGMAGTMVALWALAMGIAGVAVVL